MREGQKRLLDPEHASKATVSSWEDCLLHVMSLPGCLHLKFSLMSLLLCPELEEILRGKQSLEMENQVQSIIIPNCAEAI